MSATVFALLLAAAAILSLLLAWIRRSPERKHWDGSGGSSFLEESGRHHATYLPVIRQAMSASDLEFLAGRAPNALARRTQRERRRIAMLYLSELRADFEKLLRLARVIAMLSPEAGSAREFERLRLTVQFSWRYRLVVFGLHSGALLLPQISYLSQIVGELAARMESAMNELGERAAVAAELASSLDRRRLDLA